MSALEQILNKLSAEDKATILAQLSGKRAGFQHVSHPPMYETTFDAGKRQSRATDITNTNSCRIAYNFKVGRRTAGISMNRQKNNNITLNAMAAPCAGVSFDKNGVAYIQLSDSFTQEERTFIQNWNKAKYVELHTTPTPPTPTTEVETPEPATIPTTTTKGKASETLAQANALVTGGLYANLSEALEAHKKGDW